MENQRIFNKIKSLYIIKDIFNYIQDRNFSMKLFVYSKSIQNRLGIKLIDYKEKYVEKLEFDINKYLYLEEKKYKKDFLRKEYNNFLLKKKNNKDEFENIIYDILENKKNKKYK